MSEPIVSRERIALQAEDAARRHAKGWIVPNPYPVGSDAAAAWQASFDRWVHALRQDECTEGSA